VVFAPFFWLGDLLARFDYAQSKGRSSTTLREYKSIVDTVLGPKLGRIKLSRLTTSISSTRSSPRRDGAKEAWRD